MQPRRDHFIYALLAGISIVALDQAPFSIPDHPFFPELTLGGSTRTHRLRIHLEGACALTRTLGPPLPPVPFTPVSFLCGPPPPPILFLPPPALTVQHTPPHPPPPGTPPPPLFPPALPPPLFFPLPPFPPFSRTPLCPRLTPPCIFFPYVGIRSLLPKQAFGIASSCRMTQIPYRTQTVAGSGGTLQKVPVRRTGCSLPHAGALFLAAVGSNDEIGKAPLLHPGGRYSGRTCRRYPAGRRRVFWRYVSSVPWPADGKSSGRVPSSAQTLRKAIRLLNHWLQALTAPPLTTMGPFPLLSAMAAKLLRPGQAS